MSEEPKLSLQAFCAISILLKHFSTNHSCFSDFGF